MRISILLLFVQLSLAGIAASQTAADSLLGRWFTERDEAVFEFYKVGCEYRARLYPISQPGLFDKHNPVDSLKSRLIDGTTTLYGLIYNAEKKHWERGKIYNPSNGKIYSCTCKLSSDRSKLYFRGYIGVSALGSTVTWTRAATGKK
jgi:uncharacterized protein (DUF2147 family)